MSNADTPSQTIRTTKKVATPLRILRPVMVWACRNSPRFSCWVLYTSRCLPCFILSCLSRTLRLVSFLPKKAMVYIAPFLDVPWETSRGLGTDGSTAVDADGLTISAHDTHLAFLYHLPRSFEPGGPLSSLLVLSKILPNLLSIETGAAGAKASPAAPSRTANAPPVSRLYHPSASKSK